eukprot:c9313_g1_i1.p1 GENE.c9313_g1_i1~~c9313_g1_i1.p1  ORF type:complete len:327 (-),score=67.31 c9313_g1_i1:60-1040(-)
MGSCNQGINMTLSVRQFDTINAFKEHAFPILALHEAQNCVYFGDIRDAETKAFPSANPYLVVVERDGQCLLVAIQMAETRPFVVSAAVQDDELISVAMEALVQHRTAFPCAVNISGGVPAVMQKFCDVWTKVNPKSTCIKEMDQLIYSVQLQDLTVPPIPQGYSVRCAKHEDIPLMLDWYKQFLEDVGFHGRPVTPEPFVVACNASRAFFLCSNNTNPNSNSNTDTNNQDTTGTIADFDPVCFTMARGDTPTGVRVSSVFTPSNHRSRGYASILVGFVVCHLLTQETDRKSNVFLFADKANPASNAVYRKVGFQVAADFVNFKHTQ